MTGPKIANALRWPVVAEELADETEALRQHHGTDGALDDAAGDQRLGGRRERAQHRRDDEAAHPGEHHLLAAVEVAEPAADEQADRHRERVRGGDPLELGEGAAEVGADGGRGGLGDRGVEQVHDRRGDHHEEAEPDGLLGGGARAGGGRVST